MQECRLRECETDVFSRLGLMQLMYHPVFNYVGGVFDYGTRAYRFGVGLNEAEGKQVVTAVTQRYRILESKKS